MAINQNLVRVNLKKRTITHSATGACFTARDNSWLCGLLHHGHYDGEAPKRTVHHKIMRAAQRLDASEQSG